MKLFIVTFISLALIFSGLFKKIETTVVLQNDFAKLLSYDDSYVKITSFKFYKKSRTQAALNVSYTTLEDIRSDDQLKISVSALQFINNEFKKTVIDFTVGICTVYKANKFDSLSLIKNSNLKGCPFPKGDYYINDISPTANFLPPFFPEGKWLLNMIFRHFDKNIAHVQWMVSVFKKI